MCVSLCVYVWYSAQGQGQRAGVDNLLLDNGCIYACTRVDVCCVCVIFVCVCVWYLYVYIIYTYVCIYVQYAGARAQKSIIFMLVTATYVCIFAQNRCASWHFSLSLSLSVVFTRVFIYVYSLMM